MCFVLVLMGCAGSPEPVTTPEVKVSLGEVPSALKDSMTAIRKATPESLKNAYRILKDSEAGKSENGNELLFISRKMLSILYPLVSADIPEVIPPQVSIFPEVFRKIEAGTYPEIPQSKASFLTLFVPTLTVLFSSNPGVTELARDSLGRVRSLAPDSILPPLIDGILLEREKDFRGALAQYTRALSLSAECYPAALGASRCLVELKEAERALELLHGLDGKIPMRMDRLELIARAYFLAGNYESSSEAVAEALKLEPENDLILILKARILFAQGYADQASRFLSVIEKRQKDNPEVIMLKAQVLERSGKIGEAAQLLSAALPSYGNDRDFRELYGSLLLRSGEPERGREYLERLIEEDPARASVLELLLADAVSSENWQKASGYLKGLLALRDSDRYQELGYEVSMRVGKLEDALVFARNLYATDKAIYCLHLVRTLVALKLTDEAVLTIDESLTLPVSSEVKSLLYFYKSEIVPDRTRRLDLLRNALLENLQNTEALISIARLFAEGGDYKTAARYLRQAVALLPENAALKSALSNYESLSK